MEVEEYRAFPEARSSKEQLLRVLCQKELENSNYIADTRGAKETERVCLMRQGNTG